MKCIHLSISYPEPFMASSSNFHRVLQFSPRAFPDWENGQVYEAFFFWCFLEIVYWDRDDIISGDSANTRFSKSLDCILKEWSRHPVACYLVTANKPPVLPHVQRNTFLRNSYQWLKRKCRNLNFFWKHHNSIIEFTGNFHQMPQEYFFRLTRQERGVTPKASFFGEVKDDIFLRVQR